MAEKKMIQVTKKVWKELKQRKIDKEKVSIDDVLREDLEIE